MTSTTYVNVDEVRRLAGRLWDASEQLRQQRTFQPRGCQAGGGEPRDRGDAYVAVEDGLRALSTVMARMVEWLGDDDMLTAEQFNTVVAGLCRSAEAELEPMDWFGLGAR